MNIEDLSLRSADGTALHGRRWSPGGTARGEILLAHGLAEHAGRYEQIAAHLVAAGYRVTLGELRGHGHSAGRRGHVLSWSDYVDDLQAAVDSIGGEYYLLAHSTGCLVSLDYLRELGRARALFMSGPLLGIRHAPAVLFAFVRLLSRAWPACRLKGRFDPESICSVPEVVAAYRADPLVYHHVSARWVTEMVTAMARVHSHAASYDLPIELQFGSEDCVVETQAARDFAAACRPPLEPRCWQGLRHEILNEEQGPSILDQALVFFERH